MTPIFFKDQKEFRKWLEENHNKESELLAGYYKVGSGKPGMTWSQSVDEALCYGWIDGIRRSIDSERYCIRFTPRRPSSVWSAVNLNKVEQLKEKGLMKQPGLEVYNKRKIANQGLYSFEKDTARLSDIFENEFRANMAAWKFFTKQPPSYQKAILHWIMSAKQEITKKSRLNKTIIACENQRKVY